MKKFVIIGIIAIITAVSTHVLADNKNVCDGKNIEWLQKHVPVPPQCTIESINPVNGMCEIILKTGPQLIPLYVKDDFVLAGEMYQNKTQVTEEKLTKLKKVAIKDNITDLDNATAFTYTARGSAVNPKTVYMITDPLCPYCSQASEKIKNIIDKNKAVLKTILYTVHGKEGQKKVNEAVCRKFDFEKYSSSDWKKESENITCERSENLRKKTTDLAQKIGITGVPVFVFEDGRMVSGANMAQVELFLKESNNLTAKK